MCYPKTVLIMLLACFFSLGCNPDATESRYLSTPPCMNLMEPDLDKITFLRVETNLLMAEHFLKKDIDLATKEADETHTAISQFLAEASVSDRGSTRRQFWLSGAKNASSFRSDMMRDMRMLFAELEVIAIVREAICFTESPESAGPRIIENMIKSHSLGELADTKQDVVAGLISRYPYLTEERLHPKVWTLAAVLNLVPPIVHSNTAVVRKERRSVIERLCKQIDMSATGNDRGVQKDIYCRLLCQARLIVLKEKTPEQAGLKIRNLIFPELERHLLRPSGGYGYGHVRYMSSKCFPYLNTRIVLSRQAWTWRRVGDLLGLRGI